MQLHSRLTGKFILKLIFLCASLLYIFSRVVNRWEVFNVSEISVHQRWPLFLLVILLLFCGNIFIEALKWKFILDESIKLSVKESLLTVSSGITAGMFTPNRSGEFLGRIYHLPQELRATGIVASAVLALLQLSWTIIGGITGIFLRKERFTASDIPMNKIYFWGFASLIIAATTLIILYRSDIIQRLKKLSSRIAEFRRASVFRLFALCGLRYCVFTIQFMLMLYMLEIKPGMISLFAGVSVFYLLSSAVPSFLISELIVRGTVAVFVFSTLIQVNDEPVFLASTLIWVLNIALPAIAGAFYFLFHRVR